MEKQEIAYEAKELEARILYFRQYLYQQPNLLKLYDATFQITVKREGDVSARES